MHKSLGVDKDSIDGLIDYPKYEALVLVLEIESIACTMWGS